MRKLIFALLLGGCVTVASTSSRLPAYLAGEWVTPDFKTADEDAEPSGGFIVYLLADGRAAWFAAPEVGAMCAAAYNPATRLVTLSNLVTPEQAGPATTCSFAYDPKARTLTLIHIDPSNDASDPKNYGKMKLKRRRMELPAYLRKTYGLPY